MIHLLHKTLYLNVLFNMLVFASHYFSLLLPGGSKKDRHGSEVLTLMLQALQSIVSSKALPADRVLVNPKLPLSYTHHLCPKQTGYLIFYVSSALRIPDDRLTSFWLFLIDFV